MPEQTPGSELPVGVSVGPPGVGGGLAPPAGGFEPPPGAGLGPLLDGGGLLPAAGLGVGLTAPVAGDSTAAGVRVTVKVCTLTTVMVEVMLPAGSASNQAAIDAPHIVT